MGGSAKNDIAFGVEVGGYPADFFRVVSFNGNESLSKPFIFKVIIACKPDKSLRPAQILEKTCDLTIHHAYHQLQADENYEIGDGLPVPPRVFNGVVESVEHLSTSQYLSLIHI